MNSKAWVIICCLVLSVVPFVANSSEIYVSRYIKVANKPTTEQADLLKQTFTIHFPKNVRTIKDSIYYLLRFSGYSLAEGTLAHDVQFMLKRPLPQIQRHFGPMTLKDGLTTLVGNPFQLLVDPVHRLIAFQQKNIFSGDYRLYSTTSK